MIDQIDKHDALVVVPVGAVEQHGPHLPCITDALLAEAITARAIARTPVAVNVWTLPLVPFGKSTEHLGFPGTIALSTETLLALCRDIGRSVRASGFEKLAFLNGHGGQPQLLEVVSRDIRADTGLEVFPLFPYRLGLPPGVDIDSDELTWGLHGGQLETSLVLAVAPDLVDLDAAAPDGIDVRARFAGTELLSLEGDFPTAWLTRDLSANGTIGDPRRATATLGDAVLDHLADGVAQLFAEICTFRL
jgi:creatinine amidohydrolase/Fe(II)-dependent formamide hydrolase-like protein